MNSSTMDIHTTDSGNQLQPGLEPPPYNYEKDSNQASASRSRGGVDIESW